jgi:hypothetical protein
MHRFVIGLMALASACTQTLADEALSVCQPLCRCSDSPLPAEQRDCRAACVILFERTPLGEACVACVVEHANRCPSLLDDCGPVCTQAVPLESYGGLP